MLQKTPSPLLHCISYMYLGECVLFIDYDPSVGNMCAVTGIKAKIEPVLGQRLVWVCSEALCIGAGYTFM